MIIILCNTKYASLLVMQTAIAKKDIYNCSSMDKGGKKLPAVKFALRSAFGKITKGVRTAGRFTQKKKPEPPKNCKKNYVRFRR